MTTPMKIAVIMEYFKVHGGAEMCAYSLIEALNKKGIIPDVYGKVNFINEEKTMKKEIKEIFNKNLLFNFHISIGDRINNSLIKAYIYDYLFAFKFFLLSLFGKKYDFIYDFTAHKIPFYTNNGNYLSYPHFLFENTFKIKKSSILKYLIKNILFMILIKKQKYNFYNNKVKVILNSKYTADCVKKYFKKSVDFIYPPVNIKRFKNNNEIKKDQVISLGRFTEYKRQMEQIEIARHFPEVKFYLCGSITNQYYFEKLKKEATKTKNVIICPAIRQDLLTKLMSESLIFLHSMHGEHFGIAIAEAIAAGCIPVVHDSGGPREIVPFEELRYKTKEEAINIIEKLLRKTELCKNYRKKLQSHIEQFDEKVFQKKMLEIANL